jgi:hypothetical protein
MADLQIRLAERTVLYDEVRCAALATGRSPTTSSAHRGRRPARKRQISSHGHWRACATSGTTCVLAATSTTSTRSAFRSGACQSATLGVPNGELVWPEGDQVQGSVYPAYYLKVAAHASARVKWADMQLEGAALRALNAIPLAPKACTPRQGSEWTRPLCSTPTPATRRRLPSSSTSKRRSRKQALWKQLTTRISCTTLTSRGSTCASSTLSRSTP